MGGEGLGGLLPHLPDAQAVQQAAQVVGLGVLNGLDQVLRGLLPHPVQLGHVRGVEAVQVRGVGDQPGVDQLLDHRRTAAVDVHGVPAGEVGEVPQQLGRALRAGAAQGRAVLVPDHRGAAHRAGVRQRVGHRALRAFVEVHAQNLRDDLPRLLHQHSVPDADVLLGNEVLVVEGGVGDGGARQPHRGQHRLGRQHAGAAHLHHDVLDHGELLLRRVLEGHRPLGELGGGAQPLPVRQVVALDDRPVDVEGVVHPLLVDPVDLRLNLRRVGEGLVGDHLEVLGGHVVQGLRVVLEGLALRQLEVEHLDIQLPLRADLGVQLPQGPGGGVPGIGHEGLALQLPAGIDLREHRPGHIDLAPDDEPGQLLRQLHGDGADGLEVLRHVLPHPAVAPGGAPDEHAVPILQGHGQAVHLGLHGVGGAVPQGLPHPIQELRDLLCVEHVLEALQGYRVLVGLKALQDLVAHPLGGGVRGDLLRVLRLQLLQAPVQPVVLVVRDHRRVQNIVQIALLVQKVPQLLHFLAVVHRVCSLLSCCSECSLSDPPRTYPDLWRNKCRCPAPCPRSPSPPR